MSPRSSGVFLALVVLLATAGVATAVGARPATAPDRAGVAGPAVDGSVAPVTMRVDLQADGDARWAVSATFPIRTENESAAFEDLAEDFEDGDVALGLDSFRVAVEKASAATGREMTVRATNRSASRTSTEGTLTLAFTWTNFARTADSRLYVGDAFNTTDGTWLPQLGPEQTLLIEPPPGYGVVNSPQVGIVDGAARWEGPYRFEGREPWIVYSGEASTPTTAPPTTTGLPTTAGPGPGDISGVLPVAALVVLAGASAAALVVYMRRDDGPDDGGAGVTTGGDAGADAPATTADTGSSVPPADDSPSAGDDTAADETTDAPTREPAASAGAAAGGDADRAEADEEIDEALLSDEERVERLLERNGGRMKQANIVTETGWSNAKVSQLLSSMAEDGRIDKLRIGRENLISFPDEDVTEISSDDES